MRDARSLLDGFLGQIQGQVGGQPGAGNQGQNMMGGGQPSLGGLNLDSLLSGKGGLATGAVAGGLAGLLLGGKKPRKLAGSALKLSGMALIGGLAYKAYSDWQANKQPPPLPSAGGGSFPGAGGQASYDTPPPLPAPSDTPFMPSEPVEQDDLGTAIIRAMIAAAKADGHVDDDERRRIAEQLQAVELSPDHMAFINEEMASPLDIDAVAAGAKNPEQAAEIYAASLLAIDPSGSAERGYLAMLAARLRLEPALVDHLHAQVETIVEPA